MPYNGRWLGRDIINELVSYNMYAMQKIIFAVDVLGAWNSGIKAGESKLGHSDFDGNTPVGPFNYTLEDSDSATSPLNPSATWRHFRPLTDSEKDLTDDVKKCNKDGFERHAHQMQDFFSHYGQGFRAEHYHLTWWRSLYYLIASNNPLNSESVRSIFASKIKDFPFGHVAATAKGYTFMYALPDDPDDYAAAYRQAAERTTMWYQQWKECCCKEGDVWVQRKDPSGKSVCEDFVQPSNPYGETAAPPKLRRIEILLDKLEKTSYPDLKPHQISPSALKANKMWSMNQL